jgi:hypothetical protein
VLPQGFFRGILPVGVVRVSTGIGNVSAGFGDTRATVLTVNFRQPRVLVIHWFRL